MFCGTQIKGLESIELRVDVIRHYVHFVKLKRHRTPKKQNRNIDFLFNMHKFKMYNCYFYKLRVDIMPYIEKCELLSRMCMNEI